MRLALAQDIQNLFGEIFGSYRSETIFMIDQQILQVGLLTLCDKCFPEQLVDDGQHHSVVLKFHVFNLSNNVLAQDIYVSDRQFSQILYSIINNDELTPDNLKTIIESQESTSIKYLIELVISILSVKLPEGRFNDDVIILSHYFQSWSFIEKLNEIAELTILQDWTRNLNFHTFKKGEVIYQEGDYGDHFYIPLNGQLNIDKDYFGEECLTGKSMPCQVYCISCCDLLSITRTQFRKIVTNAKLNDVNNQITFFKQTTLFGKFAKRTIVQILQSFKLELFERNQIVYKEGQVSDYIYIIKEGEFQFSKKLEFRTKVKNVPICIIGANEIFGELDCLLNRKRFFTIHCIQPAQCYKILVDDFYKKVLEERHSNEIESYINKYIKKQMVSRNERMELLKDTLGENSNYIVGVSKCLTLPEETAKVEVLPYDRTHSRYAPIYSQINHQQIKVRYATIHKQTVAIPRYTSKTQQSSRIISISMTKETIFPPRRRPENLYDEIEVPDQIKRKYMKQLQDLSKSLEGARRIQYKIRTQNNHSEIIAYK